MINEYPGGDIPIFHFDLYRVADPSEFYAIGGDDYLNRDGIVLIEWAENGQGAIPEQRYEVTLEILDEHSRRIFISKADS